MAELSLELRTLVVSEGQIKVYFLPSQGNSMYLVAFALRQYFWFHMFKLVDDLALKSAVWL